MSLDESLFRAINGFAGQSAWLDELALSLSRSSLLWVPGILLAGYWLWLSWREALLASPGAGGFYRSVGFRRSADQRSCGSAATLYGAPGYPPDRSLRQDLRISVESRHQHRNGCGLFPRALSAVRLGELAVGRTDRSVACVYRSPLRHGRAGRLGDWRLVRSRSRVAALALFSCPRFT